jgi:hypothetical protein
MSHENFPKLKKRRHPELDEKDRQATEQTNAERTYVFDVPVLSNDTEPTVEQVVSMLELGHVVKEAPRLKDQVDDETRTNTVVCVTGQKGYIATSGFKSEYDEHRVEMSEHDALRTTNQFFLDLADAERQKYQDYLAAHDGEELSDADQEFITLGDDMRENLTFIGDKELNEAGAGLAEYWKAILDTNPNQQVLVPVGAYVRSTAYADPSAVGRVKSDKYVFDKIIEHFSEEEKELYRGRLVTDPSEVHVTDPNDLRIVLLDDWSISRKQMSDTAVQIRHELPQFASRVEVNLIVATEDQIQYGLARSRSDALPGMKTAPLPVRAYYKAHHVDVNQGAFGNEAHITGAHSAVDYNFSELIEPELRSLWRNEETSGGKLPGTLQSAPPLMNIVRPYRPVGTLEVEYDPAAGTIEL